MRAYALHCAQETLARGFCIRLRARDSAGQADHRAAARNPFGSSRHADIMVVEWLEMKSKIVAILETRTGAHLAEMITRRGGIAMSAPALEEIPDIEPAAVIALLDRWRARAFDTVIFQTGVG